ncbi:DUF2239 family protein [Psychromarinibacter sp. C21-152]|uniref:DUF2239 family protein n=1 Tax=Psychromarinibacter sediminicola TaxID=3033385 RepID=A0AAE3NN43_9RHOB|nr:DUF2239 family protein [Psychromarinibacter sediminicola]MDF0600373.1 DUF2239 family protein [Psychromarinibacter sediminicola]
MQLTVFDNHRRIAAGPVDEVAAAAQAAQARGGAVLAFDDATGRVVDLDLRGTPAEIAARHAAPPRRGRPKLGVKAREVTLLPRHWDWLKTQRGGASAALRRLVEEAMRAEGPGPRQAQDAAYAAATALAGDLPGYEEAMRALFAGRLAEMEAHAAPWPEDVRAYVLKLAGGPAP